MGSEGCRPLVGDDGQVIASVRGRHPMGLGAEAAMRELVAAARRRMEEDPDRDEIAARQKAARVRIGVRLARLRGEAGSGA